MRVKFLCLLVLLTLVAVPVWSAVPAAPPSSTPPVTLADILAPASAQPATAPDLGVISSHRPLAKISCTPSCTTITQCRDACGCTAANCVNVFGCANRVCDCTPCP
jgi:hypothetical protein